MTNITRALWASGINRWHASRNIRLRNSGDCTDRHALRCCRLLRALHPKPSADLICAVMDHDVPEMVTGDVPWGAKQHNHVLRDALHSAEAQVNAEYDLVTPGSFYDAAWVKLVDRLDAWLWAQAIAPAELALPDWQDAKEHIRSIAHTIDGEGLANRVLAIMDDCP